MRFLFFLLMLSCVACGKKQDKVTTNPNANNNPTTPAATKTEKTMDDYFEELKKIDEINPTDSVIIHEQNDNFIAFEHFPKSSEVNGIIYVSLRKLKTETGEAKFLYFMHACVEGSCNLGANNLKVYSADWQDVTAASLDIPEIQKELDKQAKTLSKDKKKKRFSDFFARIAPNDDKFECGLIDPEDQKMMQGKASETQFGFMKEMYWNSQTQKFVKEYPHAG